MKHKEPKHEFPKHGYCSVCGDKLSFADAVDATRVIGNHADKHPKKYVRLVWKKP